MRLPMTSQHVENKSACHSEERKRRRISPKLLSLISGTGHERVGEILRFAQDDKRKHAAAVWMLTMFASLLAACSLGSFTAPQPDRSRFFALTAKASADGAANSPGLEDLSLGVGPVRIPGYLDRDELVTRVAENRFDVAQNDRWAEPLEENLSRVVAQNLYTLLKTERIVRHPWPNGRRVTHQVEVEVLRFEPNAAREVQLAARWAIIDTATKQVLANKTSVIERPIKNESRETVVEALSEALADLSREIAGAVRAVAQQKPAGQK
jgi:uncharacterized lipoprotein YmbA